MSQQQPRGTTAIAGHNAIQTMATFYGHALQEREQVIALLQQELARASEALAKVSGELVVANKRGEQLVAELARMQQESKDGRAAGSP